MNPDVAQPYTLAHSDRVEGAIAFAENMAMARRGQWIWAVDHNGPGVVEAWAWASPHPSRPDPLTFHVTWHADEWETITRELAKFRGPVTR